MKFRNSALAVLPDPPELLPLCDSELGADLMRDNYVRTL
jgi:hypothetical protein